MKRMVAAFAVALVMVGGCAASIGASAPAPAAVYPAGIVKHDMPDRLPAVYTWCENGTRVFMSYTTDGGSSGRPSPALAASPGCIG